MQCESCSKTVIEDMICPDCSTCETCCTCKVSYDGFGSDDEE